jgi:hypothetical protein
VTGILAEFASAVDATQSAIEIQRGLSHENAHLPAIRLDPFQPDWALEFLGVAHLLTHRFPEAIAAFGRILDPPSWISAHIAACHSLLGEVDAAARQRAEYIRILGAEHEGRITTAMNEVQMRGDIATYLRREDRERLIAGFVSAGIFA